MKPICVFCQRFFRVVKNGYYFTEMMPKENKALPGTQEPEKWEPYKIWSGDLWECKGCGARIINGVGAGPISEQYQPDFNNWMQKLQADQFKVNDC